MMVVIKDKVVGAEKNIGIDMRRSLRDFLWLRKLAFDAGLADGRSARNSE
jgi:hypothetical protein